MTTLKDIARECGVSAMTVSSVLNNKQGEVSAATRARVLDAAQRLKYHPNAVARRLVGKGINTIGIADGNADATYWSSPYQSPIIEGILSAARRSGQDILYFTGHPSGDIATSLPIYRDGRCDGLIHFALGLADDTIQQISESGLPVVLIGDSRDGIGISYVDVDNAAAVAEAVTMLFSLGHRRIGLFMGDGTATPEQQRLSGFRQAHQAAGVAIDESLLFPGMAWELSGEERARALFSTPMSRWPTALFCYNDAIALGVLRAARAMGISVPDDISVIGFDDIAAAATTLPPLTTVRQPLRQVGERAVEILLAVIAGERPAGSSEILPHELILRDTIAPVRA